MSSLKRSVVAAVAVMVTAIPLPALAHDRNSMEIDPACIGSRFEAAIELESQDTEWLNEYLTMGEVEYAISRGLTRDMLQCIRDREMREAAKSRNHSYVVATGGQRKVSETAESWRPLVATYFPQEWVEWAIRIIDCESGGNPSEKNPNSSAAGLFQFLRGTWNSTANELGFPDYDSGAVYDPVMNIRAAAWLLENAGTGQWTCKASK